MKKCFNAISLILISICIAGCEEFVSFDYLFTDKYDAVYCFIPDRMETWVKDTTICFSKEELRLLRLLDWGDGTKRGQISLGLDTLDHLFDYEWQCDTVSFFIFDVNVVDTCSWDDIVQNYWVLQRYDFTKEDLDRIRCQISYPPSPEMKDIKMWPPYEEAIKQSKF